MTRCARAGRVGRRRAVFLRRAAAGGAARTSSAHLRACAECRTALDELHDDPRRAGDAAASSARRPAATGRAHGAHRPRGRVEPARPATASSSPPSARAARGRSRRIVAMAALLTLVHGERHVSRRRRIGDRAGVSVASASRAGCPSAVVPCRGDRARASRPRGPDAAFAALSEQHFERSKLVILGLANRDPQHVVAVRLGLRAAARRRAARRHAACTSRRPRSAGWDAGRASCRDLELVLLQTSLSEEPDAATLERLQRLIRKRDLVTKMESDQTVLEVRDVRRSSGSRSRVREVPAHERVMSQCCAEALAGERCWHRSCALAVQAGAARGGAGLGAAGAREGLHCRRAVDARDRRAAGRGGRSRRRRQGRGALLARAQPEPVGRCGRGDRRRSVGSSASIRRACGSSRRARCGSTSRSTCSATTCSGGRPCRPPPAPPAPARHQPLRRRPPRRLRHPRDRRRAAAAPPPPRSGARPAPRAAGRGATRATGAAARRRLPARGCPRRTGPTSTCASRRWAA